MAHYNVALLSSRGGCARRSLDVASVRRRRPISPLRLTLESILRSAHCKPLSSQYAVIFFYIFWMYLLALSVNADRQRYNLKATAFVKLRSWTPTYCHLKNHHCETAVQHNSIQPALDAYGKSNDCYGYIVFLYCCLCIESFQRPKKLHNWEEPVCYIIQNGQRVCLLFMLKDFFDLLVTAASLLLQDSGGSTATLASPQRCATCTGPLSSKGESRWHTSNKNIL